MEIKELKEFADWASKRKETLLNKSNCDLISSDAVKLAEETGEVANEIQNYLGLQRKEKIDSKEIILKHLGEELADVILVSTILARRTGLDIEEAIRNKMDIVKGRNC
jgi:NTP pyrophosphatase (non-canonical NTP hydrolase)